MALKRSGKLSEIDDAIVDAKEKRIADLVNHRNFDDPHIVAIFCASGCVLFASYDKRADPFIKMKELYPKGHKRPRIYRSRRQKNTLLKDDKIVDLRNVQT